MAERQPSKPLDLCAVLSRVGPRAQSAQLCAVASQVVAACRSAASGLAIADRTVETVSLLEGARRENSSPRGCNRPLRSAGAEFAPADNPGTHVVRRQTSPASPLRRRSCAIRPILSGSPLSARASRPPAPRALGTPSAPRRRGPMWQPRPPRRYVRPTAVRGRDRGRPPPRNRALRSRA